MKPRVALFRFRRNLRRRIRAERVENARLRKELGEAREDAETATAKHVVAEDQLRAVRADLASMLDERVSMEERFDDGSRG